MKKTAIFYGSTTGTTETIARRIATLSDIADADIYDVANADATSAEAYEVLLLGSPTWGFGELQDDWIDFLKKLKEKNLREKTVALFGCGDSSSYDTTFCDAMGIIYEKLENSGCRFCGSRSTKDYNFTDSKAVVNGKFIGLAIDINDDLSVTDERITQWISDLKKECSI